MISDPSEPPFGAYALPPLGERLRNWSLSLPVNQVNRRITSVVRRICIAGRNDPIDISVAHGMRIRAHPRSNRCEKLAVAGYQFWDGDERAAVARAIQDHKGVTPFVFFDIGANIGLYTLDAIRHANEAHRQIRVVAVEPDPVNRARLSANVRMNGASVDIVSCAIGAASGAGYLTMPGVNRGEVRLTEDETETPVCIEPLAKIVDDMGVNKIDAMKMDIEGEDETALAAFFSAAPSDVWPGLLIVEVGPFSEKDLVRLCVEHGYSIARRTRLNTIFHHASRLREA